MPKVSEWIDHLQELRSLHGDLPVVTMDDEEPIPYAVFDHSDAEEDSVEAIVIDVR